MENKKSKLIDTIFLLILDCFIFIVLEYLLLCCGYAFRSVMIADFWIYMFGSAVIFRFNLAVSKALSQLVNSKKWAGVLTVGILLLCVGILYAVFVHVGYLEVSPVLQPAVR